MRAVGRGNIYHHRGLRIMNTKKETTERLGQQIGFIVEIDKLKSIIRRNRLIDCSRNENSAEHSWHVALMATLLAEYADGAVDTLRVMKMLLMHDVVEIDAGDTGCFDAAANEDKSEREKAAAGWLFGLLPADQGSEYRALWEEFETGVTADAKFANAMDRLQPLLNNFHSQGESSWRPDGTKLEQVQKRMVPIGAGSNALAKYVRELLVEAEQRGYLGNSNTKLVCADSPEPQKTSASLANKFAAINEHWRPKVVAQLNGQEVKLVKFQGVFPWHHHEQEDEMFLVWRGQMIIEFRDHRVVLRQGEFCVVSRGVEHRTMADEEVEVLVFEPAATRNTGNIVDEKFTAPNGVVI